SAVVTRTCQAGGTWSGGSPTCDPDAAWGAAPGPTNGSATYTGGLSPGNPGYNATATYACNGGHLLGATERRGRGAGKEGAGHGDVHGDQQPLRHTERRERRDERGVGRRRGREQQLGRRDGQRDVQHRLHRGRHAHVSGEWIVDDRGVHGEHVVLPGDTPVER